MEHATYSAPTEWRSQDAPDAPEEEITLADTGKTTSETWEQSNQLDFIVIVTVCVFYVIIILLLSFSHRTYQSARLGWKKRNPRLHAKRLARQQRPQRPQLNRSAATRLGVPGVFSAENMNRLHTLGDMPQIPAHHIPRFRFSHRIYT
jgi:hypothetical protein